MSKFKELQEQHQRSPKEPNPFLPTKELGVNIESEDEPNSETPSLVFNENSSVTVTADLSVTEYQTGLPPDGSPNDGAVNPIEPEVIDNQVKPDTAPTDHEGEE